jgi:hypothetical protein
MSAAHVKIRDFRAQLKKHLGGTDPIVVTRGRTKIAVVLPTGLDWWCGDEKEIDEALKRMRKMITESRLDLSRY